MSFKEFLNKYPEVKDEINKVKKVYPMKVSDYYLSLIKEKGDAIWKQCIPDINELHDEVNDEDPLMEEENTPVPGVVHRYPDRVLLMVSNKCAMYCRFCTRKRKVGKDVLITKGMIINAINYIRQHDEIRDVIVSGGDPLMLSDEELEFILSDLRSIPHVEIIRIGTRVPCTFPQRVTPELCNMLKKYHPLFMNVHFEHPSEITDDSRKACIMLADSGIPLGNQAVLLKGVNDDPKVLKELFHKLIQMRVKPYYLYQADAVKGTDHFKTRVQDALEIMKTLYGFTSGMCVPQYIIDAPGGGKIPMLPDYTKLINDERVVFKNFEGKIVEFVNPNKLEVKQRASKKLNIAIAFNLKKEAGKGEPEDAYAEYDEIEIPLAIKTALEKGGHTAELVEANADFFDKIRKGNFNFVFNIAEGVNNGGARESQVPAILDMLGISYTGSGVLTQAITLDKKRTKEVLMYNRVPTPRFQVFNTGDEKINPNLRFPLFVKPNAEGSSKGIKNNSLVHNENEMRKVTKSIINTYKQAAIVEEYLDGREFTISVLGNNPARVMPIVEITFDHLPPGINKFDSYEVKWYWDSPTNPVDPIICPAKVDDALRSRIENVAINAYNALGCVDLCRMDMRLDEDGMPNVIDVNALPGLIPDPTQNSRFPKSCYTAGMKYEEIILSILGEAMKRHGMITDSRRLKNENRNPVQLSR